MACIKAENDLKLESKILLSCSEASELTGIGINRIRMLAKRPEFSAIVFMNGNKTMLKRAELEKYLLMNHSLKF